MLRQLLGQGAPESSIRPQPRPDNLGRTLQGGLQNPREGFLNRLLSDPVRSALFLQTAAGLLASRGIGPSLGMGLGAAGRAAQAQAQQGNEMEAERQRAAAVSAARGGGGGGGSPQGAAAPADDLSGFLTSEQFRERRDDFLELLNDDADWATRSLEERIGYANILAMEEAGISDGASLYRNATREDQAIIAREFMNPGNAISQIRSPGVASPTPNPTTSVTPPAGAAAESRTALPRTDAPPMAPSTPLGFGNVGGLDLSLPGVDTSSIPVAPGLPLTPEEERRRMLATMGVNVDTIPRSPWGN